LLLRSAEGKPSFASISPMGSPDFWRLVGVGGLLMCRLRTGAVQGSRVRLGGIPPSLSGMLLCDCVLDGAG
jgi:hypothetical protein